MSEINTGGPAFPPAHDPATHQSGMSLRDYFAAKTMQAIYARLGGSPSAGSDHDGTLTYIAEGAYQMADAMIKMRQS